MLARNGRLLAAACLLLSLVPITQGTSSGFSFGSACVNGCVGDSGCGLNNPKCMCKAAQGNLMETVLVCMFWHCDGDLRDADQSFLGPLQDECKSIGKSIPQDDIRTAQAVASSLASKLGGSVPTSTAASPHTSPQPLSTTTTPQPTTKQTTTVAAPAKGTTSSTSTSTSLNTPSDTPTSSPGPASSSSSQASTPAADVPNSDPTDSSPFATPIGGAGRSMGSVVGAGLPLALALLLR
ncbi:hypothetical protein GQ53DRAFT_748215 [Thozetella sp. PMI_491]|nr:hypothetical protein GQ53DRAFT_748215 [Thozetella sp. PMI_491]